VGQALDVYYDPANPSFSVSEVERGYLAPSRASSVLVFAFAAGFVGGGVWLLVKGGAPGRQGR
jgi:hypothetical protein